MAKRRKHKKKSLSVKDRRKKMLKGSEWILLGVLFVGISEFVVKYYGLTWRYVPYALAVWMVLITRILLKSLRIFTKGVTYLLSGLSELE